MILLPFEFLVSFGQHPDQKQKTPEQMFEGSTN